MALREQKKSDETDRCVVRARLLGALAQPTYKAAVRFIDKRQRRECERKGRRKIF